MKNGDAPARKLERALAECDLHWLRLGTAAKEVGGFGPIDVRRLETLSDVENRTLDQVLFRFGRLQDAMGARLFPAVLQSLGEWHDGEAFIDRLSRLEKLRIIDRAETWMNLRELRNLSAHEYPDQPDVNATILTRILSAVETLGAVYAGIRDYLQRRRV